MIDMATKARVLAAFRAMKSLGIHESKTKPALKKLLKLYDKNWELIEEENYRVLADAIFDFEDTEVTEKNTASENTDQGEVLEEEAQVHGEPERPLKRLRKKGQDVPAHSQAGPASGESSLKKPKVEPGTAPETSKQRAQETTESTYSDVGGGRGDSHPVSPPPQLQNKGKQPVSPQIAARENFQEPILSQAAPSAKKRATQGTPQALQIKEHRLVQSVTAVSKENISGSNALIKPKDEPFTDDMPPYEIPLAVVHPESMREERPSNANGSAQIQHSFHSESSKFVNGVGEHVAEIASSGKEPSNLAVSNIPHKSPATLEIAASPLGEVKISLNCNFVIDRPNFHVPSLDEVVKHMEDKCLRSYKILDPSFSVKKLMRDFCDSFLELGTTSNFRSDEQPMNPTPPVDEFNSFVPLDIVADDDNRETAGLVSCSFNGSAAIISSDSAVTHVSEPPLISCSPEKSVHLNIESFDNGSGEKESISSGDMNMNSIVVVHQHDLNLDVIRCLHDVNDITRGEEKVTVPLLLDPKRELLPLFHYIPQNVVSQNAYVNLSLAQIGDEDCCASCCGDCFPLATSCACTRRNGGDFAYTSDGLVKEEVLEECISMVRNPQKHQLNYCEECPLERCKNEDVLEPCKGHLVRKFIKECWSKCGCGKYCINRVVQRGITYKFQVFFTPERKGWGLRTLEDLPKGAFVCEYVGEILTIKELHQSILGRSFSGKNSYSVLLDADWGSGILKDEQTLCLDATSYGNVARFINHRCLDANLIEIPVEVDTPNHLYYRVAFFTTRKVVALEELTWDYGIDFDDADHDFKSFRCLCGSSFCRNMKRSNRSRTASVIG